MGGRRISAAGGSALGSAVCVVRGISVGKVLGRGGNCEYAAGMFGNVIRVLFVAFEHCTSAAGGIKQLLAVSVVKGVRVGTPLKSDCGHCNSAAEGGGRVEVASGKGVGHWRTPAWVVLGIGEVWGGKDASTVLAWFLEFFGFLAGGRLERA